MRYITLRILYPGRVYDIPCQSLIPINTTLEYNEDCGCAFFSDGKDEIVLPISKEKYIGIIQQLKYNEVVNTNLYAFKYDDEAFERMTVQVGIINGQKGFENIGNENHYSV